MARSQLVTPASISGQNNIRTPFTDLVPTANPRSNYQGSAEAEVAGAPKTNGYEQLANALGQLQPTLQQLTAYTHQADSERLTGEAMAESTRVAQDKNIKDLKAAQAAGYLPNGASPIFIKAWKENYLKLRAEQGVNQMQQDYLTNDALRNSDDPNAFDQWKSKWWNDYRKGVLASDDGEMQFSLQELGNSNFDGILTKNLEGVKGTHIKWRVDERERLAGETADNLAHAILTKHFQNSDGTSKSWEEVKDNMPAIAQEVGGVYWSKTGMAQSGGMTNKDAMERFQENILTFARVTRNPQVLELGNHTMTPGGSMGRSQKWMEKGEQTRQYIAGANYTEMQQREQTAKLGVIGKTLDERLQVYELEQNIHMQDLYRPVWTRDLSSKIYLHQITGEADIKNRDRIIERLMGINPEAAWQVKNNLRVMEEHQQNIGRTHLQDTVEMGLMNKIMDNPLAPDNENAISQAVTSGALSGDGMRRLLHHVQVAREKGEKYSALGDKGYKDLEYGVYVGVGGDPTKMGGRQAVVATNARWEFRQMALSAIEAHPELAKNGSALAEYMHDKVQKLVERFNIPAKTQREEDEKQAKIDAAVLQEKETYNQNSQVPIDQQIQSGAVKPPSATGYSVEPKAPVKPEIEKKIRDTDKALQAHDAGKGPDPNALAKKGEAFRKNISEANKKSLREVTGKADNPGKLHTDLEAVLRPAAQSAGLTERELYDTVNEMVREVLDNKPTKKKKE